MWYWVFKVLFTGFFKLFFKFNVVGLENLPEKTNFIIAPNHTSFLDPLCIMVAIPKKIYCIAARYLYGIAWIGWFLRGSDAVPSGNSSDKAIRLLSKNRIVGLFPEGGCTSDGQLGEFRRGVALMAIKTGRPIVPCAIIGTYQALPINARFPRLFQPITVKVGKPIFLLKEFDQLIDDIYLQEGILRVRNEIQEMLNAG